MRAVIFDFGGVILTSPFEAFARYEQHHGLPEGFLRRLNAANPDDNAWARLERNQVDMAGFARLFESEARAAGHPVEGQAVLALLAGQLRPVMVEALRRCHDRLKTALLTNNFVPMDDPDRQRAAAAGSDGQMARAMGMTTIKVTDPATALAELEQVVGFPLR